MSWHSEFWQTESTPDEYPQKLSRRSASRDSTNQNALFVEWFSSLWRAVFWGVYGEIFALFQACVGNFHTIRPSPWPLLEHFIMIVVTLLLHILLSWAFVTSLNCSVMCKPLWWFECCFCRSSWIHCWLRLGFFSSLQIFWSTWVYPCYFSRYEALKVSWS